MKVSVIVAVYNIEKYLGRCLDSICQQTYDDIEIIVVNDGSTDGSKEIAREYAEKDSRIIVVDKKNGGLSDARNAGVDCATGDAILFVDGDDYLDLNCIEILVERMLSADAKIVLFPYIREFSDKSVKSKLFDEEKIFSGAEVKEKILARLIGPDKNLQGVSPVTMDRLNTAWGKLYKIDVIKNIRFVDTKIIGIEDGWFNINVFFGINGKAVYTEKTWYHYEKKNSSSLLHTYMSEYFNRRWNFYKMLKIFLLKNGLEKYQVNYSNRLVCELFGVTSRITTSTLTQRRQIKEISKVISDQRYVESYARAQYSAMSPVWRVFYTACRRGRAWQVYLMLKIVGAAKK